jgi:hypothetical protein
MRESGMDGKSGRVERFEKGTADERKRGAAEK